jgi:hypothetical protein
MYSNELYSLDSSVLVLQNLYLKPLSLPIVTAPWFTPPPLIPMQDPYIGSHLPYASFTLKMATAMYTEKLKQLQHTMQLNLKIPNYTLDGACNNLRIRNVYMLIKKEINLIFLKYGMVIPTESVLILFDQVQYFFIISLL